MPVSVASSRTSSAEKSKQAKPAPGGADKPMRKLFQRRQEAILIAQLRASVRELTGEIDRLSERNQYLEENAIVKDQQLAAVEGKLALQKAAWEEVRRQTPISTTPKIPQLNLREAEFCSAGSTPTIPEHAVQPLRSRAVMRPVSARPGTGTTIPTSIPENAEQPPQAGAAARRPMSARPEVRRPLSAREPNMGAAFPMPQPPPVKKEEGASHSAAGAHRPISGAPEAQRSSATRPFSAREPTKTPSSTPRTPRPSTARPALGRGPRHPHVAPAVSEAPIFSKFQLNGNRPGSSTLSFKTFSANVRLNQSAAQSAIKSISEQTASFDSLGVFLTCAWAEVCSSTAEAPSPNYFRLAVCCTIFDKVVGVVGMYSDLLLELRKELYSCLFRGFDPEKMPTGNTQEYAQMLPWFVEFERLNSDRENHKRTIERLKQVESEISRGRRKYESLRGER